MHASYDTIMRSRALLNATKKPVVSEATAATYRRQMRQLFNEAKTSEGLIKAAQNTTKVSSWYTKRAAILFATRELIEKLLQSQDQVQRSLKNISHDDSRWDDWKTTIQEIGRWSELLTLTMSTAPIPIDARTPRHSKKMDMKGLPKNWRECLIERMPNYHPIVLTAAICGCRPDELMSGVTLLIDSGFLVAVINGSKNTNKSGQPWRRLTWPTNHPSPLIQLMLSEVAKVGGEVLIQLKSAKNFHSAVRAAARREWPSRKSDITPYCFRHAIASDAKAAGLPGDMISMMLGHCVDATKSRYGHKKMGSAGGASPTSVNAAREIKKKNISPASLKRHKSKSEQKKND